MKKKLLFLVSHVSFFISHRLPIAISAKQKGYEVIVVFGELDADTKVLSNEDIDFFHISIERGGKNFLKDLKSIYLIWKIFKKIKPNIVHLVTIKPYLYGGIIARLTKVPCVVSAVSGLGSVFIQKNFINKILRILLYPIYKFSFNHPNQCVIVQNRDDAELLTSWGVLDKNKIQLVKGSGVNLNDFKQLEESQGIPTVSFVARLLRDKGIYEFVTAANLIQKRNIKANFLIAGDLDLKNPSGLKVKDLDILKKNKNLEILGHQNNIAELYFKSHIVCLPSYREGLPKALIEAAAASRAVITTDVPGCRDVIIPDKSGILVPVKDSKKLADAIEYLIDNPEVRVSMGKEGRKFAEDNFKIENIIINHLEIYKNLQKKI